MIPLPAPPFGAKLGTGVRSDFFSDVGYAPPVLRFSLRWLLLFVAFVAIGVASLRYASKPVSEALSVAWLTFLLTAVFGVIYRRERQRAFWLGCCVFGWPFAGYGLLFNSDTHPTTFDRAIEAAHKSIEWSEQVDRAAGLKHSRSGGGAIRLIASTGRAIIYFPRIEPFTRASRALVGVLIAVLGGVIARWFHATRDGHTLGSDRF